MKKLILLLLSIFILSSCDKADEKLILIENTILEMSEADDYFTDFDKDWKKSK